MERSFGKDAGIYDLEYTWNPSTDLSDIFIYMESVDRFVRNIYIHVWNLSTDLSEVFVRIIPHASEGGRTVVINKK